MAEIGEDNERIGDLPSSSRKENGMCWVSAVVSRAELLPSVLARWHAAAVGWPSVTETMTHQLSL
jgi:hypothetical protein